MLQEIEINIPIDNPYIILFSYYKDNHVNEKGKQSFLIKKRQITPKIKIGQPVEWYFGSHGYIINKKTAEITLEKFKVSTLPAEYLLCFAPVLGIILRITQFLLGWINDLGLNESDIQLDKPITVNQSKTVLKF